MRYVTRFFSGTTTFWIDWEKEEVVAWLDPTFHGHGEGLPEEFTFTEAAENALAQYIEENDITINIPEYEILRDERLNTYDVFLPSYIAPGRVSQNGNAVLETDLEPKTAFKWLIAILHDDGLVKGKEATFVAENAQIGNE